MSALADADDSVVGVDVDALIQLVDFESRDRRAAWPRQVVAAVQRAWPHQLADEVLGQLRGAP